MSLEKALKIFEEQDYSLAQWVIDVISRAESKEELNEIMRNEKTGSSAEQFVSNRLISLYKGDLEFKTKTFDVAKEKFGKYGLPEKIVSEYIFLGGGQDNALYIQLNKELFLKESKTAKIIDNTVFIKFFDEANQYLFETLRSYVINS